MTTTAEQNDEEDLISIGKDLYRLFSSDGTLLYVGISKSALSRITQHARDKSWWSEVASVTIEFIPGSRIDALVREEDVIRTEKPKYNITHNSVVINPKKKTGPHPVMQFQRELLEECKYQKRLRLSEIDQLERVMLEDNNEIELLKIELENNSNRIQLLMSQIRRIDTQISQLIDALADEGMS